MAGRFFTEPVTSNAISVTGHEHHHMTHVMRLKPGALVTLFDGSGQEFSARIEQIGRSQVQLQILESAPVSRELEFSLRLGVALPKGDRQQWLIEKSVELGVTEFVPLETERGVAQPREQSLLRLQKWVIEASKQCGRNQLMTIGRPESIDRFLARSLPAPTLLSHPGSIATPVSQVVRRIAASNTGTQSWALAIGPEGGFTDSEVATAQKLGCAIIDLGPRILRIETAALAALSAVIYSRETS